MNRLALTSTPTPPFQPGISRPGKRIVRISSGKAALPPPVPVRCDLTIPAGGRPGQDPANTREYSRTTATQERRIFATGLSRNVLYSIPLEAPGANENCNR